MPDVQILNSKSASNHSDYVLPGSAEFTLKAVYAEFEDNGTIVNWMPSVLIIGDSGQTIAEATDRGVLVTAGDDAEVSFFPGLKHASGGASGGAAPDTIRLLSAGLVIPSVAGGYSGELPWLAASVITTGTNIWTFNLDGGGNIVEVKASAAGVYEMWAEVALLAPSASVGESLLANVFGTIPLADQYQTFATVTTADPYAAAVGLLTSFASGTAQFAASVDFDNNASGQVAGGLLWIKHWSV